MRKSYEARDFNNGICIYNGACRPTLISEINEYTKCQKQVEFNNINNRALKMQAFKSISTRMTARVQ
ncbi:hypothetical protein V6B14_22500 (plasmid) [Sporosarcina psychrophila]|uniref:hypothetical protein n=1 Tax=Sporosarcina psychrophila TaxID=1476 RepID=UPI0030D2E7A6